MNRRNFLATIIAAVVGKLTIKATMLSEPGFGHSYSAPRNWRSPVEAPIKWPKPLFRVEGDDVLFLDELGEYRKAFSTKERFYDPANPL